ncbi:hypothetical protein TNCV_4818001 [Trichonephila clavipes]|nr:hypothetical protein TNCV_4818001 [Trichonephila clavipes]
MVKYFKLNCVKELKFEPNSSSRKSSVIHDLGCPAVDVRFFTMVPPTIGYRQCVVRNYPRSFDQAINSAKANGRRNYLIFLQEGLAVLLQSVPTKLNAHMWFQHDEASAHFSTTVQNALDTASPGRWSGRSGPVN